MTSSPDSQARRRNLARLLKLMTLCAVAGLAYILFGGLSSTGNAPRSAERFDLTPLSPGAPQLLEWQGKQLVILKQPDADGYLVALNYGTTMGCPLIYHPAGSRDTPVTPWPGGFRESCADSWYDNAGRALPGSTTPRDLMRPPHQITADGQLWIGVE